MAALNPIPLSSDESAKAHSLQPFEAGSSVAMDPTNGGDGDGSLTDDDYREGTKASGEDDLIQKGVEGEDEAEGDQPQREKKVPYVNPDRVNTGGVKRVRATLP